MGQSSCKPCSSGTYSIVGASSCSFDAFSCPTGTYADGIASCNSCEAGKYNDQPNQTSVSSCKDCGTGSYVRFHVGYINQTEFRLPVACETAPECAHKEGSLINRRVGNQTDAVCQCGAATCTKVSGLYCTSKSNLCTKGKSQCGSASTSFEPEKCLVVTDRCICTQCISGHHTANCSPCKNFFMY